MHDGEDINSFLINGNLKKVKVLVGKTIKIKIVNFNLRYNKFPFLMGYDLERFF